MTTAKRASASKANLAAVKDVDVLDPQTNTLTLVSGTQVEIQPLKSRQFFKLMRIVTRGAGDAILSTRFDSTDSDSAFAAKLIALIAFAIPEAEDATFDFLASMCKPVGAIERKDLSEEDKERNIELWARMMADLHNPELSDTLDIIEKIIRTEAPNLKALGKKIVQMTNLTKD